MNNVYIKIANAICTTKNTNLVEFLSPYIWGHSDGHFTQCQS